MNAPHPRTEPMGALTTGSTDTPQYLPQPAYIGGQSLIFQGDYFDRLEKLSNVMAKAKGLVPAHLLGNAAACFGVAMVAARANFDPFGVARKTWMGPDGTIKYESQLVIALINNSGLLAERLRWEYFGEWKKILGRFERKETKKKDGQGQLKTDNNGNVQTYIARKWADADEEGLGVRCIALLKGEREPRVTELLMAQAVTRNSTLWVEDPRQQIGYLSGFRWGRLHTPEAIMGIYTPDEPFADAARDMGEVEEEFPNQLLLASAEAAAKKGVASYTEFWRHISHMDRALLDEKSDHHNRLKQVAADADKARTVDTHKPTNAPKPGPTAAAPPPPAAATPSGDSIPPKTYAQVVELMQKASDEIGVEIAGEWIEQLPADQQAEAVRIKDECLAKLKGGA